MPMMSSLRGGLAVSLSVSAVVLVVAGCGAVLPKGAPTFAVHDFGPLAPVGPRSLPYPIRTLEVIPAPWLASTAMQYRLAYAQPTRRQAYVQSRWAAQPGQMLEVALRRSVRANVTAVNLGGCRLRVDLDEFMQVFDSESASRGLIEARASLLAPRTDQLLATQGFSLERPAPGADAPGGVAALRDAVQALDAAVLAWLDSLSGSAGTRCTQ